MTANSYAAAGVDIAAGTRAVDLMRAAVRATHTPDVVGSSGSFGGLYRAPSAVGQVLVSSTDGVGTKLKVAIALGRHDTIGRDLVHHCIDDILTLGARPLFFLDYIGINSLVPETVAAIVGGLAAACRDHGVALVGGETAELPDHDLAGFIVGTVAEADIVDGRTVEAGDVVIGLPSDGLHTNGYSLARRVFADADLHAYAPELGTSLGVALLRPHRCYLPEVAPWLGRGIVKAMAHITGGGLPGNVPRTLPEGLAAALDPTTWEVPPIFRLIEQRGGVSRAEMYRVFNMGIGYTITCAAPHASALLAALPDARAIGHIVSLPGGSHDAAEARVLGLA